ncbi:MAG: Crp/Fnr family transcriptional regulator [Clostridia bacterium]|nr:Crp/Fnr family transcriptional regulator [Clostridia bacterium]
MNNADLYGLEVFSGISHRDIDELAHRLGANSRRFNKDEFILSSGSETNEIGIVLKGSVLTESTDTYGKKTIYCLTEKNGFFGEICFGTHMPITADIVAAEDCEIIFIGFPDFSGISGVKPAVSYVFISNLFRLSAKNNSLLADKIADTSAKTIRGRVMSFLSRKRNEHGDSFLIPYDRQQLAEYLGIDRSALSNELSKMKKDGLIDYKKNSFKLTKKYRKHL